MKNRSNKFLMSFLLFAGAINTFAQGGEQGIQAATAEINKYFDDVSNLILIIGAIVGLIGGVRVYVKWNNGDPDVNKAIMSWFGACIFLVLVAVVIKAFFGVS